MDVRCEKCQTEYELDEARLKPGGVTVKCTNCGHMFKIRKRTPTNVGAPAIGERNRPTSSKPPMGRADSILGDIPRATSDNGSGPTAERQWMIRLETGEQRSCRELAVLQQWIIAGIVTRESLISRTGKTWKRLGDVTELGQYFTIADEARQTREDRTTHQVPRPAPLYPPSTMPGVGGVKAAGGTVLPDDDEGERTTGSFKTRQPQIPPRPAASPPVRTPPMGSPVSSRPPVPSDEQVTVRASYTDPTVRAQVLPPGFGGTSQPVPSQPAPLPTGFGGPPQPAPPEMKPAPNTAPKTGPAATAQTEMLPPTPPTVPTRRPTTTPPPPPRKTQLQPNQPMPAPASNRATAMWASDGIKPSDPSDGDGPSFGGRLAAIPDEPAFMAGRVRVDPADERSFETGKVRFPEDDEDLVPGRTGSGAGKWIALVALLVMAAAAGVIYMVIRQPGKDDTAGKPPPPRDAAVAMAPDAAPVITPIPDAAAPPPDPLEVARGELLRDDDARLKTALTSLDGKDEPPAQALRAQLASAIAQSMLDRAGLLTDKSEADKLRKDAKTIVVEAAPLAQKALKAKSDEPAANLAMAEVLRLQGKPARDVKRYLDAARAKADKDLTREVTFAEALLLARDGKLEDAKTNLAALDQGDGKLEKSGDVRARYHLALVAFAQGKPTDAKPLVEQILAAQPEHPGARALAARLETAVAKTDPLPPEDGAKDAGVSAPPPRRNPETPVVGAGEGYDRLLQQGNALAEKNCAKAMEFYAKALEQKPNGVEALTGMGYCHIDRKEFASAQSKFRAALAVSPRYEPALYGIAEGYAQQGRKEDAISAFKAYLEIYPNSAKAKRRLDMLGGGSSGENSGGGASPGSAAPPPPQPPPPQPPPAGSAAPPAGAGSGSG